MSNGNAPTSAPNEGDKKGASDEKGSAVIKAAVISAIASIIVGTVAAWATINSSGNRIQTLNAGIASAQQTLDKITIPPGTIIAYGGLLEPEKKARLEKDGWLVCDGDKVSKTNYWRLYERIGDFWGPGNHLDKFSLPNLQGMFLRGVDPSGTNDFDYQARTNWQGQLVGGVVGSLQADQLKNHRHKILGKALNADKLYGAVQTIDQKFENNFAFTEIDGGGNETRPKNAYVYFIIKY